MRCRFTINGTTVTATTKYAGNIMSASAKCHPDDEFNEAAGKAIAEKKLEVKVANKRERYYAKKVEELTNEMHTLSKKLSKVAKLYAKAVDLKLSAEDTLDEYMTEFI